MISGVTSWILWQMLMRGLRRACFASLEATIGCVADRRMVFRMANVHIMLEIESGGALLNIRRDRRRDHLLTKRRGVLRKLDDSLIEGGYNLVRSRIAQPFGSISYALGRAPKSDNDLQLRERTHSL